MVVVRYVGRDTSDEGRICNKGLNGWRGRREIGNGEKEQSCSVWEEEVRKDQGVGGGEGSVLHLCRDSRECFIYSEELQVSSTTSRNA